MMSLTIRMKRHHKIYGVDVWQGDVVTLPAIEARRLISERRAEHLLDARYPGYNPHGPREVVFHVITEGQVAVSVGTRQENSTANTLEANASY